MKNMKTKTVNKRIITLVTSYIFFSCLFFSSAEENSKPAWLGIVTSKVDPIIATQLDLPEGTGAAIKLIVPESPAEKAGLKKHDIIFEINGTQIKSPSNLSELISSYNADESVEMAVIQRGKKKTVSVKFEERPDHLKNVEENNNQLFGNQIDFGDLGGINFDILPFGNDQNLQEQIQKMQEQMRKNLQGMFNLEGFDNLPGKAQMFGSSSQTMTFNDEEGSIEIRKVDGKTTVITKDLNGKVTFEGPANTDEEKDKIPERAKTQLNKFKGSGLSFEGFNFGSPGIKVPQLKPGKKIEPIPPAKKDGKKIQL